MTKDWRNSIDNREAVAAVAVDLSKALAFDAITTAFCSQKLKAYGFCPHALDTRHNYNVKWPNFELTWARDRRGDKFYSPSLNSDAIPSLQFQPNFPTFKWLGIRAKKFIFQRRFHWCRRCRIVRSLLTELSKTSNERTTEQLTIWLTINYCLTVTIDGQKRTTDITNITALLRRSITSRLNWPIRSIIRV